MGGCHLRLRHPVALASKRIGREWNSATVFARVENLPFDLAPGTVIIRDSFQVINPSPRDGTVDEPFADALAQIARASSQKGNADWKVASASCECVGYIPPRVPWSLFLEPARELSQPVPEGALCLS